MSKIIDYRLRPPLRGMLNMGIWNVAGIKRFSALQGVEPAASALERSMDMLLQDMQEAGISIGVINGRQCSDFRGECSNEDLLAITADYPGVFYALAGANPCRGPENVVEAERYLRDHGFKGIALDPGLYEEPMLADDPRLFCYYEVCLKYDYPAVITTGPGPGPDISYTNALQFDRLAARFPELKIVVAHGAWPYTNEICGVAARRPNVYLMPDMYYLGLPGEEHYTAAINTFATDRFLFATAYPSRPLQLTVEQHRRLPLRPGALDKILYQNAARLLKLEL